MSVNIVVLIEFEFKFKFKFKFEFNNSRFVMVSRFDSIRFDSEMEDNENENRHQGRKEQEIERISSGVGRNEERKKSSCVSWKVWCLLYFIFVACECF